MLEAAPGSILEAAVILGLAAGRVAEACGVRCGDLDLSTGMLTVGRSWWGETKSGKTRQLTLPASQIQALRRVKREEAELLALGMRQENATPIVTDALGRQMPPARSASSSGASWGSTASRPPSTPCAHMRAPSPGRGD
jgi:integrase